MRDIERFGGDYFCWICREDHASCQVCTPWPIQKAQMAVKVAFRFLKKLSINRKQREYIYGSLLNSVKDLGLPKDPIKKGWRSLDNDEKGEYSPSNDSLKRVSVWLEKINVKVEDIPMKEDLYREWGDIYAILKRDLLLIIEEEKPNLS